MTATQAVLSAQPTDDAGAQTADRFEWQAAMAAADALSLYRETIDNGRLASATDAGIVCEHHEDWVVIGPGGAELVSGKHRDPSVAVFTTTNQLLGDGGLAHLFGRWHAINELPYCRLVTTAGLAPGEAQGLNEAAVALRKLAGEGQMLLASGTHEAVVIQFAKGLQRTPKFLPAPWKASVDAGVTDPAADHLEQAARFLSVLRIDEARPQRTYISDAAPNMYCVPVLQTLGHDALLAVSVWEAVMALFRARMRAAGPTSRGALPHIQAGQVRLTSDVLAQRELAKRTVTIADLNLTIRKAVSNRAGYLPIVPPPRTTRLGIKMEAGLCADNSIERAEQLRSDYLAYWSERDSGDPLARSLRQRLQRALLAISDDAATAITDSGAPLRGPDLWRDIKARVKAMPPGDWPEDLDADLRLGGICDLTAQCLVWFSERFDIAARLAAARSSQGDAS